SNTLFPYRLVRRAQINQIGSVQDNRIQIIHPCSLRKSSTSLRIIPRWTPPRRITRKNLYSLASNLPPNLGSPHHLRTCRHMATNTHYLNILSCSFPIAFPLDLLGFGVYTFPVGGGRSQCPFSTRLRVLKLSYIDRFPQSRTCPHCP